MRYSNIDKIEIINGEGVGCALFVQGCPFHCAGCFNPETWNFDGGKEWNSEIQNQFICMMNKPYITRVTILGGEPLAEQNLTGVLDLLVLIKRVYPEKRIWLYSGYKYEQIRDGKITTDKSINFLRNAILRRVDVFVDGPFIQEKKDLTLKFRGSSNQRIIDLAKMRKEGAEEYIILKE